MQRTLPATAVPQAFLWLVLLAVGCAWGVTTPLSKFTVSFGLHPLGMTFWQSLLAALILTGFLRLRGKRLPVTARHLKFYFALGLLGTALPHPLGYVAAQHLPASVISIVLSSVPLTTLLLAMAVGIDRPNLRRTAGLLCGVVAVAVIAAPEGSLPSGSDPIWIALPILSVLCYSSENVWIDASRPNDLDAMSTLCGLSWAAFFLIAPMMAFPGTWVSLTPFGPAQASMLLIGLCHLCAYLGLIWLISQAGAVFATQVGYVVMGSGVLIAILFLGETPPPAIGLALGLMVLGVMLVKPR